MRGALRFAACLIIGFASACSSDEVEPLEDASVAPDAQAIADSGLMADGSLDAGAADADGDRDADLRDAASRDVDVAPDAAPTDATPSEDATTLDAAAPDATFPDATAPDATAPDATALDAAPLDATPLDATPLDATPLDAAPADALPLDAAAPDATPTDSGLEPACNVAVNPPDTNAGQVGANGGSPGAFIDCGAGEEAIGVAVRMSNQNTANGGPSAVGFTLVCAQLAIDATGPVLSPESLHEIMGNGQFGWTPATQSTITRCPPKWLVSGLSVSRGASADRFIDVTLTCSEMLQSGALSGATQDIYVVGSLMEAGLRDTIACPSGQVVRRLGTRIGAGFDAATLYCATPTCGP